MFGFAHLWEIENHAWRATLTLLRLAEAGRFAVLREEPAKPEAVSTARLNLRRELEKASKEIASAETRQAHSYSEALRQSAGRNIARLDEQVATLDDGRAVRSAIVEFVKASEDYFAGVGQPVFPDKVRFCPLDGSETREVENVPEVMMRWVLLGGLVVSNSVRL